MRKRSGCHGRYRYLACHWRSRLSFLLSHTVATGEAEPRTRVSGRGPNGEAKMQRISRLMSFALLSGLSLFAHDFWIEPSSYQVAVGSQVTVRFLVGEEFRGDPLPLDPSRVIVFARFGLTSETPVRGVDGADPAGVVSLDDPGLHLIAYRSTSVFLELDAEKFESYLRSEGLEGVIDERSRRNERKAKGRELYSRCVKSLLRAGVSGEETGFDRVLKFPVELVPELNPYGLSVGDELPVRILRQGKPLAGVLVVAHPHGEPSQSVQQRSDERGRIRLPLAQAGPWLVTAVHMERIEQSEEADWESWWASLTFKLPRN